MTESVQNVAKSSTYFHYNQYGDSTAFATNGMRELRACYRRCAHYAGGASKGPNLIPMDPDSYANFEDSRVGSIRTQLIEDNTHKTNLLELGLGPAKVYEALDLDRADFTGDAADGIAYLLNTEHFEFIQQVKPNVTKFTERVGDQDVVTATFEWQGQLMCLKLVAQGVVTGLAS